MMSQIKKNAAFLGKHLTALAGALFLLIAGVPVNKKKYEKRVLVIFGGGVGDVVIGSVACGYIKKYLDGYDVRYLMPYAFELPYATENIRFNYRRAKESPLYYFQLVNQLRDIGFSEVILLFPFWEGFLASLAGDIGSKRVFFYKENEMNAFHRMTSRVNRALHYFSLRKRAVFIPVVSGWGEGWAEAHQDPRWPLRTFPSIVSKQAHVISQAIKTIRKDAIAVDKNGLLPLEDPRTEIVIDGRIEAEFLKQLAGKHHVRPEECCLIGLGSSDPYKNWPVERFAAVAKAIRARGLKIAIIDQAKDAGLVAEFAAAYGTDFFDLGADADLPRLFVLIKHGAMVVANDTSFIHLAIALKTPSVCVVTNAGMGAYSLYGYERVNIWVNPTEKDKGLLTFVFAPAVISACEALIDARAGAEYQKEKFQLHFGSDYPSC